MTPARPGRPRIAIAPLTDVSPAASARSVVGQIEALLEELYPLITFIESQSAPAPPSDPARVPLNERGALNAEDTAIYMGVGVGRVYQLRQEGHLKALRNLGANYVFLRKEIDAFLEASHDEARKVA